MSENQRIIFFGDSITQLGDRPGGFVSLVRDSLLKRYSTLHHVVIGAGVSGDRVTDLQRRLQRDVLKMAPTVVVMYIGINDVWHFALPGLSGTPALLFDRSLRDIVRVIQGTGAQVVLCTPSVIGERADGNNPQDTLLDEYAAITRVVAHDTGVHLCDLRRAFLFHLKQDNPAQLTKGILTTDGVHLNEQGNALVARELLRLLASL